MYWIILAKEDAWFCWRSSQNLVGISRHEFQSINFLDLKNAKLAIFTHLSIARSVQNCTHLISEGVLKKKLHQQAQIKKKKNLFFFAAVGVIFFFSNSISYSYPCSFVCCNLPICTQEDCTVWAIVIKSQDTGRISQFYSLHDQKETCTSMWRKYLSKWVRAPTTDSVDTMTNYTAYTK